MATKGTKGLETLCDHDYSWWQATDTWENHHNDEVVIKALLANLFRLADRATWEEITAYRNERAKHNAW